jgi:aminoglycoside phosphotransferase (APT) family kinase protein
MPFAELTPDIACEAMRRAGISVPPQSVRVHAREARWVVDLPGNRIAWFPASDEGTRRLTNERRVLRLLADRCSFAAPRVLFEDPIRHFDIRSRVPGISGDPRMFIEARDRELARRAGAALGAILAEQHTRINAADVADWLPKEPNWPETTEWIRARLGTVVNDARLIQDAQSVMDAYADTSIAEDDRVLVHGDIGFHNLSIDPVSHAVLGIFDYEDASWADRHHDFRYLVFDEQSDDCLDAALSVYEPAVGRTVNRARIFLYNAACAITFLANRAGSRPEDDVCGRTLSEDLRWSKHAIARALASNGRM